MKKSIIIVTILALLNLLGCYSYQTISKDEIIQAEECDDLQVITKNKYVYEFDKGNYTINEDSIFGSGNLKLIMGKKTYQDYEGSISFEDVEKLRVDKFDMVTTILVVAVPVAIIVIAAANFKPLGNGPLFSK